MEDRLKKMRFRPPDPGLRDRILDAAHAEAPTPLPAYQRILRSEAFWLAAAAAILLVFALHLFSVPYAAPETYTTALSPETEDLRKTLSGMLDDGQWLTRRFEVRLPVMPRIPPNGGPNMADLLREFR